MIKLTLVMEEREAEALVELFGCIGGYGSGPRGLTDKIKTALINSGVEWVQRYIDRTCGKPTLWFHSTWPSEHLETSVKCERI